MESLTVAKTIPLRIRQATKHVGKFHLTVLATLLALVGSGINASAEPTSHLNDTGITFGGSYPEGNNPDYSGETIGA